MHIISPVIVKKPLPITENRATQVVALLQDDNN